LVCDEFLTVTSLQPKKYGGFASRNSRNRKKGPNTPKLPAPIIKDNFLSSNSDKSIGVSKPSSRLLIAVVTSPEHFKAREAIRNTYASESNRQKYGFEIKFFIGDLPDGKAHLNNKINEESNVVRLSGFVESYNNLAAKALGIFNWGWDNGYDTVFKVDDDSFIRPDYLRGFISQHDTRHIFAGHIVSDIRNKDNPKSKWYFRDQYPFDILPTYAIGAGILLGSDCLQQLSQQRHSLPLYRVDDAAVGIWLEKIHPNFRVMAVDIYPAHIRANSVIVNPVNHREMYELSKTNGRHLMLQICQDTCLCIGTPRYDANCVGEFANSPYKDIVPRVKATAAQAMA